ncbi:MAG TPA: hypothetical protein VK530_16620 [Candidatus Acidoferrum sp.]|nr:hypothetical protein [Candidatus Acidoferrum sp.]
MLPSLPTGSDIHIETVDTGYRLIFHVPRGAHAARWLAVAFLVFWLWGWSEGEVFTAKSLMDSTTAWPVRVFLLFWLAGWTFGGLYAALFAMRLAKRPRQEALLIDGDKFTWTPPYAWMVTVRGRRFRFPSFLAKGKSPTDFQIHRKEITSITIECTGSESGRESLVVRRGSDSYAVGSTLNDSEARWLCALLTEWKNSAG